MGNNSVTVTVGFSVQQEKKNPFRSRGNKNGVKYLSVRSEMKHMKVLFKAARDMCSNYENDLTDLESEDFNINLRNGVVEEDMEVKNMASEYFKEVFGNELTEVLIKCAVEKPDDPVVFIAEALEQ